MGFSTGVAGGVAATLGLAYLTLYSHQRTRETQSQVLRAQTTLLDDTMPRSTRRRMIAEDQYQRSLLRSPYSPSSDSDPGLDPTDLPRRQPYLIETAKERWNNDIISLARWVQRMDWNEVRSNVENDVSTIFGGIIAADEKIIQDRTKTMEAAAADVKQGAKEETSWLWAGAKSGADDAKKEIEDKAWDAKDSIVARAKEGIAAGKTLFDKAKETVGDAVENAAGQSQSQSGSVVQKALRERYEKPDGLDRTVAQALEERYVPLDKRDNTVLRGV